MVVEADQFIESGPLPALRPAHQFGLSLHERAPAVLPI
jgi:hypothetical protein